MRTYRLLCICTFATLVAAFSGCNPPATHVTEVPGLDKYNHQLPPGALALRKITNPAEIPDFTQGGMNLLGMRQSVQHSIEYMNKPSSQQAFPYGLVTHQQAMDSLKAFGEMLDRNPTPQQLNAEIRERFDVYMTVGCDDAGAVLFTGYYTPIFNASPVKTDRFRCPLYKSPAGLQKLPDGTVVGIAGENGAITKPTRKEIEDRNMFAGNELFWLADPFEVHIAHVQGSAKLRMPDGSLVTVGYSGSNGHDYVSVGKILVADGKIPADKLSLPAMIDFFKAHPEEMRKYLARDPRFVFFAVSEDGPHGSLNVPVSDYRSIATDKSIFPRGAVAYIIAPLPRRVGGSIVLVNYRGFACDQDTGNGIRAAGRCDIYVGVGDEAGQVAGHTMQEGKLYYLFLKPGQSVPTPANNMAPPAPVSNAPTPPLPPGEIPPPVPPVEPK
jgi:membrane-bound lytic murein transglycosylase A